MPGKDAPSSIAADAPTLAGERVIGIDLVRAFAALGVVWVHAARSPDSVALGLSALGSWGTAFLNVIAGYFVVVALSKGKTNLWSFAGHRVWRLGAPFVVWTLIYFGARYVNYAVTGNFNRLSFTQMLFTGTIYHLWFLPYLILITLITLPLVGRAVQSREHARRWCSLFMVMAIALLMFPMLSNIPILALDDHLWYIRFVSRAPGFLIGVAIGLWMLAGNRSKPQGITVVICVGVVVACAAMTVWTDVPRTIVNRVAAVAAFIIALAPWEHPVAKTIGKVGAWGFGIYLCHALFCESLLVGMRLLHIPMSLTTDVLVAAATFVLSASFVYCVRRIKRLRWLVP